MEKITLTHRRHSAALPKFALQFAECDEGGYGPNESYGPHVWTLRTELPEIHADLIAFAAEYLDCSLEQAELELNPDRIVSDAGLWDNREWCYECWEKFGEPGYRTNDGAVVLDQYGVELAYSGPESC